MAFIQRQLRFTFTLGTGSFTSASAIGQNANTTIISGVRAQAKIVKAGGRSMSTSRLAIYGMKLSDMNQLSTLGMAVQLIRRNTVLVEASDEQGSFGTVFWGTITNAYMDPQGMPDVAFRVEAHTGLIDAVTKIPPTSYSGPTDAATFFSSIAAQMGYSFQNNGVQGVMINNPYYKGSPQSQWMQAAEDYNITAFLDDTQTLVIMPKDGNRGGSIPVISPTDHSMVGYPSYTSKGIMVRCRYNPSIGYRGQFQISGSQLTPANGTWTCYSLDHNLDALTPNGSWFSDVGGYNPALPTPLS